MAITSRLRIARAVRDAAAALLAAAPIAPGFAQESKPASAPADVRAMLSEVADFGFSYASSGFYALFEQVKLHGLSPDTDSAIVRVDDWRALLERAADYRGAAIEIDGVVRRCTGWTHQDRSRRHLDPVWELQLTQRDQPLIVKAVLATRGDDLPVGARVTLVGYFLQIQQYYGESGAAHQAAVLVAAGPRVVTTGGAAVPIPAGASPTFHLAAIGVTAALALIIFLVLRRRVVREPIGVRHARPSRPAPLHLAGDLDAWAKHRPPGDP